MYATPKITALVGSSTPRRLCIEYRVQERRLLGGRTGAPMVEPMQHLRHSFPGAHGHLGQFVDARVGRRLERLLQQFQLRRAQLDWRRRRRRWRRIGRTRLAVLAFVCLGGESGDETDVRQAYHIGQYESPGYEPMFCQLKSQAYTSRESTGLCVVCRLGLLYASWRVYGQEDTEWKL